MKFIIQALEGHKIFFVKKKKSYWQNGHL